jgi:hypothetical protein
LRAAVEIIEFHGVLLENDTVAAWISGAHRSLPEVITITILKLIIHHEISFHAKASPLLCFFVRHIFLVKVGVEES